MKRSNFLSLKRKAALFSNQTADRRQFFTDPFRVKYSAGVLMVAGFFATADVSQALVCTWKRTGNFGDGNWSDVANWNGGVPDGSGIVADFSKSDISKSATVTLDSSRTVGTILIGDKINSDSYLLRSSNGATLTFDNGGSDAVLSQVLTSHGDTISAPIVLASSLDISNASANALTLSGGITGTGYALTVGGAGSTVISTVGINTSTNGTLAKDGTGTLTLNAVSNYTGETQVAAGTLKLGATSSQQINSNSVLNVSAGAIFQDLYTTGRNLTFAGLKGAGTLTGGKSTNGFVVGASGTLAPGDNGIGTLTIGVGGLILPGTATTTIDLGASGTRASAGASDRVVVAGNLSLGGGSLVLNNATGSAAGGSYKIFTYGLGTSAGTLFGTITDLTGTRAKLVDGGSTDRSIYLDVYNLAQANTIGTVTVGATLAGTANTATVTLTNVAPINATYTETLTSSGFSATSTGFTATGSVATALVAGGASNSTSLVVGLGNTLASGHRSGTTTLALSSNAINSSGLATVTTSQTVTITGDVYDPAQVTLNNGLNLLNSGTGTLVASANVDQNSINAAGTQNRADWTALTPRIGAGAIAAVASFNGAGHLNGTYSGQATIRVSNVTVIGGAINGAVSGSVLTSGSYGLSVTVAGNTSTGAADIKSAEILAGGKYSGYGLTSAASGGRGTVSLIPQSDSTTSSSTTLGMSFGTTPTAFGLAVDDANRTSDILKVSGVEAGKKYVLQLSYSPGSITALGLTEQAAYLGYFDAAFGHWVNAIAGNTPSGNAFGGAAIQGAFTSANFTLGAYGVDTTNNVVWAVVDHGGVFAVIPETPTSATLIGGFGLLCFMQRFRRGRSLSR